MMSYELHMRHVYDECMMQAMYATWMIRSTCMMQYDTGCMRINDWKWFTYATGVVSSRSDTGVVLACMMLNDIIWASYEVYAASGRNDPFFGKKRPTSPRKRAVMLIQCCTARNQLSVCRVPYVHAVHTADRERRRGWPLLATSFVGNPATLFSIGPHN